MTESLDDWVTGWLKLNYCRTFCSWSTGTGIGIGSGMGYDNWASTGIGMISDAKWLGTGKKSGTINEVRYMNSNG